MDESGGLFFALEALTVEAVVALLFAGELAALLSAPSVLLRRRGRPTAALAWLLALFALPALGALLWWAFGRSRIERRLRRHGKSRASFSRLQQPPPGSERASASVFLGLLPERSRGESAFATPGNEVDLLTDGVSAFDSIEQTIRSAETSIAVFYYVFMLDETGRRICDVLEERARAGVSVQLLVDGFGSAPAIRRLKRRLEPAGVKVAVFLQSRLYPLHAPRFNFINHRKIVVVDQRVAFCGGMNVADHYRTSWKDLMLRIRGPAVAGLSHVLLEDWYFATKQLIDDPLPELAAGGHDPVDVGVVASGPDTEPWIHDAYFTAITRAEKRVFIATPYFIPTPAILTAMRTASGRGVDVRLIIPARSDIELVKWASRSFYPGLVQAGVRIFEYQATMLHAKALLVDDRVSAIGTANIDNRSFNLNFEVACFLDSPTLNDKLHEWFTECFEESEEMSEEFLHAKGTPRKLLESAAHLLSPLL